MLCETGQGGHVLYATEIDDVYVEALRISYDGAGWRSAFLEQSDLAAPPIRPIGVESGTDPSMSCLMPISFRTLLLIKGGAMPKATWNGVVVADAPDNTIKMVEGNVYFPPESVNREHLTPSETMTQCHWKGSANYFNVAAGDEVNPDAAWVYNNPLSAAKEIAGYVAFWRGVHVSK